MAGLQRSSQTFRRSGSSGLVWDGRLMSEGHDQTYQSSTGDGEASSLESKELRHSRSIGSGMTAQRKCSDSVERSRSGNQAFRTRPVPPAMDPPSPKVSHCLFCGIFSKEEPSQPPKPRRKLLMT
ncbi:MAPK kinase substrate protein At1g80180-like isoform X2 [Oryza brachyantha]|uniref:MAPK kinase substrate protein At1g80180-like isoform X2 n=1 Tax=Oryza brachyantha TaxID=4533 RepID=UPI000776365B|nr:MAPK kinase substrate protein At1g80180-like isoform X2 [Oryza brachyantha]